eukprot:557359-Rhodomonas_salina.1
MLSESITLSARSSWASCVDAMSWRIRSRVSSVEFAALPTMTSALATSLRSVLAVTPSQNTFTPPLTMGIDAVRVIVSRVLEHLGPEGNVEDDELVRHIGGGHAHAGLRRTILSQPPRQRGLRHLEPIHPDGAGRGGVAVADVRQVTITGGSAGVNIVEESALPRAHGVQRDQPSGQRVRPVLRPHRERDLLPPAPSTSVSPTPRRARIPTAARTWT